MRQVFASIGHSNEVISFDDLKHLVVSASRSLPKGEVLELADALHDALRERRCTDEGEMSANLGA